MASGVPGVVTDVGDAAEIVADTGLRVPPADSVALAQALDDLLSAPADLRQGLGRRARERVLTHYGLAAMVEHSAALYRELAGTS
jgi:glycosyltransferase involved in cell wall biosynthesis